MSDDELKGMLKELTMTGFNAGYTFAIEALKNGSKVQPENECFFAAIEFLNQAREACAKRYVNGLN